MPPIARLSSLRSLPLLLLLLGSPLSSALQCYEAASKDSNATLVTCDARIHSCVLQFSIDLITGARQRGLSNCWTSHESCGQTDCLYVPHNRIEDHGSCCCKTDACNVMENIRWVTLPTPVPTVPSKQSSGLWGGRDSTTKSSSNRTASGGLFTKGGSDHAASVLLISLAPVLAICVIVVLAFFLYTRHQERRKSQSESIGMCSLQVANHPFPVGHLANHIRLKERLATGKFGCVYIGEDSRTDQRVAVKVFPPQERGSWLVEQELYSLPEMAHPNILCFIGADQCGQGADLRLWLVTEYHPLGSAHDYLAGHTVSWIQLLDLAESLSRGLAFLHEGTVEKPAIAHRDIKSRNVLIRSDLSCCIADLGLAKKFFQGEAIGDVHPQVGTRRYMSPEVLEGAMSFYKDSFLRVDVYSLGLVLWEMLTRCTDAYGEDGLPPYRLPFEAETGSANPSLLQMQAVVVNERRRPEFPPGCQTHQGLSYLRETISCCWDHVPEARLTAACVAERCKALRRLPVSQAAEEARQLQRQLQQLANQRPAVSASAEELRLPRAAVINESADAAAASASAEELRPLREAEDAV